MWYAKFTDYLANNMSLPLIASYFNQKQIARVMRALCQHSLLMSSVILTRAALGSPAERAALGAGGTIIDNRQ